MYRCILHCQYCTLYMSDIATPTKLYFIFFTQLMKRAILLHGGTIRTQSIVLALFKNTFSVCLHLVNQNSMLLQGEFSLYTLNFLNSCTIFINISNLKVTMQYLQPFITCTVAMESQTSTCILNGIESLINCLPTSIWIGFGYARCRGELYPIKVVYMKLPIPYYSTYSQDQ